MNRQSLERLLDAGFRLKSQCCGDLWNAHGCSCDLRWKAGTGRRFGARFEEVCDWFPSDKLCEEMRPRAGFSPFYLPSNVCNKSRRLVMENESSGTAKMPVGRRERGGERGERERATMRGNCISWRRERRGTMMMMIGSPNKRASDFMPKIKNRGSRSRITTQNKGSTVGQLVTIPQPPLTPWAQTQAIGGAQDTA